MESSIEAILRSVIGRLSVAQLEPHGLPFRMKSFKMRRKPSLAANTSLLVIGRSVSLVISLTIFRESPTMGRAPD